MKRIALAFVAAVLSAVALSAQQVQQVTIQASQVSGIVNATTTRNTVFLTNTAGRDAQFLLNVTNGGAATGVLNVFLEDSLDAGTTWNDLCAFRPFTFGAAAATQVIPYYGTSEGPGLVVTQTVANPAAGAEFTITVPARERWEVMAVRAQFVTSATVANRVPQLIIDDGVNELYRAAGSQNLTASATWFVSFGSAISRIAAEVASTYYGSFPTPMRIAGGGRLRTSTVAIQVGDQYSAIAAVVRSWTGLDTTSAAVETMSPGVCRSGPYGDRIRVREVVSGIGGSPTGVTYAISAVIR